MLAFLNSGMELDFGGIGKEYAADRAASVCRSRALSYGLVNLGGDIAVWGLPPEGGSWRLAVADPRVPGSTLGVLDVRQGGVATSGRDQRRFGPGRRLHHLIDPTTAAPAHAGPLAVTVVAPDAAEAEVHATALALVDPDDAAAYLCARPELAAVVVPEAGAPLVIGPLRLVRSRQWEGIAS